MTDFVARGGWWVLGQAALLTAVVLLAAIQALSFSFRGHQTAGWALVLFGVVLALVAAAALGSSLSAFPAPLQSRKLVARGPYRIVRHPIYTGVILGSFGIAIAVGDWLSLIVALVLVPFFYAKTIREERHLLEAYADYEPYRQQVTKRIVPGVL